MAGFIARWLSESIELGVALTVAIGAMQLPAIAHAYSTALLQISEDARRDIDQRKEAARQYYHLRESDDDAVVAALRASEPSNAEGLAASIARTRTLRDAYEHIEAAPPLLQPVAALADALSGPADKRAVLRTALDTHVPQIIISAAAAIYGLAGLVLGALLAQILLALLRGLARPWRRRRAAGA